MKKDLPAKYAKAKEFFCPRITRKNANGTFLLAFIGVIPG